MSIFEINVDGMTLDDFAKYIFKCKEFSENLLDMMKRGELDRGTATSMVAATCIPAMLFSFAQDELARYAKEVLKDKDAERVKPKPMGIPVTPSDKQS